MIDEETLKQIKSVFDAPLEKINLGVFGVKSLTLGEVRGVDSKTHELYRRGAADDLKLFCLHYACARNYQEHSSYSNKKKAVWGIALAYQNAAMSMTRLAEREQDKGARNALLEIAVRCRTRECQAFETLLQRIRSFEDEKHLEERERAEKFYEIGKRRLLRLSDWFL